MRISNDKYQITNAKNKRGRNNILRLCAKFFIFTFLVFVLVGCDAFVRKFTRKKTKIAQSQEEVVIAPEEYKPTMSKEELYRQHMVFWRCWQDELIESLLWKKSYKKRLDCADEAIKNLNKMGSMLKPEKQKGLGPYIQRMIDLRQRIGADVYGNNTFDERQEAERLKRDIQEFFSYADIKADLI